MTIVIAFHQFGYLDFKTYYIHFVCCYPTNEFPELISYTRMLKLMQSVLVPLCSYLTLRLRQGRQELPSLIHPIYRFATT
ncbi:Mobile element protein [Candidatus Enterovibrio escicola]|uniref:Mobile element protein n=1 Tax=Candidatus Enterovibrio escicola TaxID=1927127 RepID=A0A2A5T7P4_9GAMM|nr:hypothetical protein [Candidatus Enterovibrio escacola]PCS24239.1 Mobile element protein [Candidatus Enterovibrio escacola]